jgi:hypothetical protein
MTTDQQPTPPLATAGATAGPRRQAAADDEQLRVLSVLYFAYGGLAGAFSLMGLAFVFAGTIIGSNGAGWWGRPEEQAGAAVAGCFLAALGSGLFVLLGVTALLRILVGVALRRHRYYLLCLVAASLTCFGIPFGTALGVATLIVLLRPSTERLFSGSAPSPPGSQP